MTGGIAQVFGVKLGNLVLLDQHPESFIYRFGAIMIKALLDHFIDLLQQKGRGFYIGPGHLESLLISLHFYCNPSSVLLQVRRAGSQANRSEL